MIIVSYDEKTEENKLNRIILILKFHYNSQCNYVKYFSQCFLFLSKL